MGKTLKYFTAIAEDDIDTFMQILDEGLIKASAEMAPEIGIRIGYEITSDNGEYILTNFNHNNVVEVASRFGSMKILKYIFDKNMYDSLCSSKSRNKGQYYKNYMRPVSIATKSNQLDAVKFLVDKIPITLRDEYKFLKVSISAGYIDMAKFYLCRNKVNINSVRGGDIDLPLICYCCGPNEIDMLNILLSYGANVNISEYHYEDDAITPLRICIDNGNLEGIKVMMKHGLDVNRRCGTAINGLWYSAVNGNLDILEFIFANCSPDIEMKDCEGSSILQKMITKEDETSKQIVRILK